MPNQMIALQARNPQLPDPARITAQYANMMNTAAQQRAAQLQGERIRQEMDYARAGEERAAETQRLNVRKEDQAFRVAGMTELRNRGVAVLRSGSEEAYQLWLKQADAIDPDSAAVMRQIAPTFNKDAMTFAIMKADEYINKTFPNAEARVEYAGKGGVDAQGRPIPENTPVQVITGIDASTTPIEVAKPTPQPTPRATPTASPAAEPANPFAPGYEPNSAAANPNSLGLVIDSALETGVMSKSDYDKLLSIAPPESRAKIAAWVQQNNVQIMSDMSGVTDNQMRGEPAADFQTTPMAYDGQTPASQFAVMRGEPMQSQTAGLRGAPPMEQTLAQYIPVQRKDPNVGAYPGSATVPLSRVAREAQARLEPIPRIKERKVAELQAAEDFEEANKTARLARKRQEVFEGERAKKDAAFLDTYNDATTKGRTTLNVIDQMIGDARLEKGRIVIPKGGRRPHPGFEGVVGMGIPGMRFIPGTQAASFDALFRQAEGGAFLQAYESLRGTGQITEIEGSKATSALTRMERSQTEVEFVKAAREFADVIRGAIARADKRYTALTGEAPPAAPTRRRTPTKGGDGWGKAKVVRN